MNSNKTTINNTLISQMVMKMPMGMYMHKSMICVYMQGGLLFKSGHG